MFLSNVKVFCDEYSVYTRCLSVIDYLPIDHGFKALWLGVNFQHNGHGSRRQLTGRCDVPFQFDIYISYFNRVLVVMLLIWLDSNFFCVMPTWVCDGLTLNHPLLKNLVSRPTEQRVWTFGFALLLCYKGRANKLAKKRIPSQRLIDDIHIALSHHW